MVCTTLVCKILIDKENIGTTGTQRTKRIIRDMKVCLALLLQGLKNGSFGQRVAGGRCTLGLQHGLYGIRVQADDRST